MRYSLFMLSALVQLSSVSCATSSPEDTRPALASASVKRISRLPAGSGETCYPQAGMNCLVMPGLEEGQQFRLKRDLGLDENKSWLYFTNGAPIAGHQLVKNIGQTYCAITAVYKSESARNGKIAGGRYALSELSWFVNTIFLKNAKDHFVLYCSTVDEQFTQPGVTSAAAIQKDLRGVLEILP